MIHLLLLVGALAHLPCSVGEVRLTADFEGARAENCRRTDDGFAVDILPEATPINESPWYAFELKSVDRRNVAVTLNYRDGGHRYEPKFRRNGGKWSRVPASAVAVSPEGQAATITVALEPGKTRIAAQPVVPVRERMAFWRDFADSTAFDAEIAGRSAEGRPILQLTSLPPSNDSNTLVLLLGGQHPPEVPGIFALRAFLKRLAAQDALATRFRRQVVIIAFPLLNPDGVASGNWRFNARGADLNRDWGRFDQPETAAVMEVLNARAEQGDRVAFVIDFHATWKGDLLYTPTAELDLSMAHMSVAWPAAIADGLSIPPFKVVRVHKPGTPTAKTWFTETYGVPGITLEIGDETDAERTTRLAAAAAEAMMEVYLAIEERDRTRRGN